MGLSDAVSPNQYMDVSRWVGIRDYMKLQLVIGSDLTWELVGYIKRGQFRAPVSDSMKLFPDDSGAKIAHKRFTRDIFLFHCLKNCQIILYRNNLGGAIRKSPVKSRI